MLGEGTEIEWKDSISNENLKWKSWGERKCWCCETAGVCLILLSTGTVHVGHSGSSSSQGCRMVTAETWMSSCSTLNAARCDSAHALGAQRSLTDRRRTVKDVSYVSVLLLTWVMWPVGRGGREICATVVVLGGIFRLPISAAPPCDWSPVACGLLNVM